jgi:outer membrane protein OmpA-like peptidoglycan-associated protein
VTVVFDRGRITLRGLVADDGSHDTILAAAEAAVGASLVRDRLQEYRGVKPVEWTEAIPAAIGVAASLPDVTLAFGEGRTLVTGAVATDEVKARVAAALRVVGVTAEVDSLRVVEPQEPWILMERTSDEIVLTGLVGRDDLDEILTTLQAVYGDLPVTRAELMLAGNSAEVEWPRQVASLIRSTSALVPWHLRAAAAGVSLFGVSEDPTAPSRVASVAARYEPAPAVEVRLTTAAVVGQISAMTRGVQWFDGRTDSLEPDATLRLDAVVAVLFANPEVTLTIEARSAPRRDLDKVRQSGLERAAAVRSYLVARGLDPMRIEATGSSEATEDPAAAVSFMPGRLRTRP